MALLLRCAPGPEAWTTACTTDGLRCSRLPSSSRPALRYQRPAPHARLSPTAAPLPMLGRPGQSMPRCVQLRSWPFSSSSSSRKAARLLQRARTSSWGSRPRPHRTPWPSGLPTACSCSLPRRVTASAGVTAPARVATPARAAPMPSPAPARAAPAAVPRTAPASAARTADRENGRLTARHQHQQPVFAAAVADICDGLLTL